MARTTIPLAAVDAVRIRLIMDNSIDILLAGTPVARRLVLGPNPFERPLPIAEHGFSALIEVEAGEKHGTVLFDTGISRTGILYNMDAMEIDARAIRAIVLSHGHADHAMGLPGLIDRLGSRNLPLVVHPDVYLERRLLLPDGTTMSLPPPRRADLRREHLEVIEEVGPSLLVDRMILVSGEVARTSPFETGLPSHQARRHEHWEPDPQIMDDQCAIIHVRQKGLVIVTGCGHSGIINIIRHAQSLTGCDAIYAVVGGFHLSGPVFEPRIEATVTALAQIGPRHLMPGHCTGWVAAQRIAQALPEAYIANSVGTTLLL